MRVASTRASVRSGLSTAVKISGAPSAGSPARGMPGSSPADALVGGVHAFSFRPAAGHHQFVTGAGLGFVVES